MAFLPPVKDHFLPSREVSYAYAVAMYYAQQFELNLRAILYTADYHAWIPELKLNADDKKKFKNPENLIDKATCGKLIAALKETKWIKKKEPFSVFERACQHRNKLAHTYLTNHDFDHPTKQKDAEIIRDLYRLTMDLYGGLIITRRLRQKCEAEADKMQADANKFLEELGADPYDNPDRHFATRKKKRNKSKRDVNTGNDDSCGCISTPPLAALFNLMVVEGFQFRLKLNLGQVCFIGDRRAQVPV